MDNFKFKKKREKKIYLIINCQFIVSPLNAKKNKNVWLYHVIKKALYHIWIAYVCFPAAANRDKRLLQEQPGPDAERDRQPKEVSNTWNGLVVSCKKNGAFTFFVHRDSCA